MTYDEYKAMIDEYNSEISKLRKKWRALLDVQEARRKMLGAWNYKRTEEAKTSMALSWHYKKEIDRILHKIHRLEFDYKHPERHHEM